MTIAYHFTGDKLRDGTPIPPIGFVLEHPGPIKMCKSGLHWSREPFDALTYAPGPMLHKVKVDMIAEEEKDKGVSKKRTILQTIDATELLRKFARQQALSVIHLWNAPQVVKGAEAWAEARDAAWDAAWAEARAAARDAARAAARKQFNEMVYQAF